MTDRLTDSRRLEGVPTGRVVGVDGCAGGWFAVWDDPATDGLAHAQYDDLDTVFAAHAEADRLLVDIPIGLTNAGPRVCDQQARQRLGLRGVSVFPAPCRAVVEYCQQTEDASYQRAGEIQQAHLGSGLSRQAWNITNKIAAMDAYVRNNSLAVDVYESHPECCFAALNDGYPLGFSKSTQTGRAARFAVLDGELEGWKDCYVSACEEYYFNQVARDDIIDAMVLTAAGRHSLATIPENPPEEAGLPLQIVIPESKPAWVECLSVAER